MNPNATTALVPAEVDTRAAEIERQVAEAKQRAEALQVTNPEEAQRAGRLLREIAGQKKRVEDDRKKLKEPVLEAGRRIDRQAKEATASIDAVDAIIRPKLGAYEAEQERLRREEEARLEEERQERERKAREAREMQEAEERRKREQAEADRREAEQIALEARDEEERAQAEELVEEARIKAQEAEVAEQAIASLPEVSLPKAVVEAAPKPTGISTRKRWAVRSIDVTRLPAEYLIADEMKLRHAMRAGVKASGEPPAIDGVIWEQVDEMAVRA